MLINFTVKNWMSFRDESTFTMVAGKERQHGDRLPRIKKYQMRALPVSAIYGGNASGKTNFFKALSFAKSFIVRGTNPESLIAVEPFKLDGKSTKEPSVFVFEILADEMIYEFSFTVNYEKVLEEKLIQISSTSERDLYHRKDDQITFDESLNDDQFLKFAFQGTRDNQLYLTNSVMQKVETFKPVYDWFNHTLELIAPDSRFEPFEQFIQEDSPLYEALNTTISFLDTGITQLGGEEVPFNNIPVPKGLKNQLQEEVKEGIAVRLTLSDHERFLVSRKDGELIAKKLVTYHNSSDGSKVKFDMQDESDGSQRVIDLVPVFIDLALPKSNKVYIIDEIDRSLHTLLTQQLLETYLESCSSESRSQLLFTTHDILLMDQKLFRRDEMWVSERDREGSSDLIAFSDYKDIRYDKDIRKSYLQGRLGGIPHLLLNSTLLNPEQLKAVTGE